MRFYIILTIDIPKSEYIGRYKPEKKVIRKLKLTEGDEQYDMAFIKNGWETGKHRKYVGTLSKEELGIVVNDCGLMPERAETLGAITVDDWMPIISFFSEHERAFVNAYVTPLPGFTRTWANRDERVMWERLKKAVVRHFK